MNHQANDVNPTAEVNEREPYPSHPSSPQPITQVIIQGVKPTFTYGILALTILVYIFQAGTDLIFGFDVPAALGMKVNYLIQQGQVWRLLTPMLLHGSIIHLALNMYALVILGQALEPSYGHLRFLLLYLLAGFSGNVFSTIFSPHPSLGSSTAVFGLIAAQGVFIYQNREYFGKRAQRALTNIILVAVINFVIGLSPGIDNWGHLGGFLGGTVFAWFGGPLLQGGLRHTQEGFALILTDERSVQEQMISALTVGTVMVGLVIWYMFLF